MFRRLRRVRDIVQVSLDPTIPSFVKNSIIAREVKEEVKELRENIELNLTAKPAPKQAIYEEPESAPQNKLPRILRYVSPLALAELANLAYYETKSIKIDGITWSRKTTINPPVNIAFRVHHLRFVVFTGKLPNGHIARILSIRGTDNYGDMLLDGRYLSLDISVLSSIVELAMKQVVERAGNIDITVGHSLGGLLTHEVCRQNKNILGVTFNTLQTARYETPNLISFRHVGDIAALNTESYERKLCYKYPTRRIIMECRLNEAKSHKLLLAIQALRRSGNFWTTKDVQKTPIAIINRFKHELLSSKNSHTELCLHRTIENGIVYYYIQVPVNGVFARASGKRYLRAQSNKKNIDISQNKQSWERWTLEKQDGGKYALKSHFGTYLRVWPDGSMDQATWLEEWERFTIYSTRERNISFVALKSHHGFLLQPDYPMAYNVNSWEIVKVENYVYLRNSNGKYLQARDDKETVGLTYNKLEWEKWEIERVSDNKIAFKSKFGTYLRAWENGAIDQAPWLSKWEKFRKCRTDTDNKYAFKTHHDRYLKL